MVVAKQSTEAFAALDAAGRVADLVTKLDQLDETRHYYYTPGWQCVEERVDTSTNAERQFVWGLRHIDDLIIRDRSTANNGSINERRYGMQDGNWNMIAICDITGFVGERYAYSAYGTPVFMTGAGTAQTSSPIGFETLYAGYRWDSATPQMYYVRNRFLLPQVGTWNRRDPLGYVDGTALYSYGRLSPIIARDFRGTDDEVSVTRPVPTKRTWTGEICNQPWWERPQRVPPWLDQNPHTCIFITATESHYSEEYLQEHPERSQTDWERWRIDAERYKALVDREAIIIDGVTASNIATHIRDNRCCKVILMGHRGGLWEPGIRGSDKKPIFPNPEVEAAIGWAREDIGCDCEIDVLACGVRGIVPSQEQWHQNFCFYFPWGSDPAKMECFRHYAEGQERSTWEQAAETTGCTFKTSVHLLNINMRHTCVPGGVNRRGQNPLVYPLREVFPPPRIIE
jgi:RHS repeat-associated protein